MAIERRRGLVSSTLASTAALPGVTRARDRPSSHSYAQDSCDACSLVPSDRALADEGNRAFGPPHLSHQMNLISTHGWTFGKLLDKGSRFKPVPRVSCRSKDLDKELQKYEDAGVPLVVDGWQYTSCWPNRIFNLEYCRQYFNERNQKITVRNMHTRVDKLMRFGDFLEKSRNVAAFVEPEEVERWYGKDVECPQEWEDWLRNRNALPDRLIPEGCCDHFAFRQKQHGRPDIETLMCYFGVADTYTPCHTDLCASSGQNLMCYTERDGSSFWFMTKGSDSVKVTEYFHTLRQELNHEVYTISVEELAAAPFDVYIVEQKLGDLVLVPPRSCHQVINSGGMTIKMSWSRMTLAGLSTALYYELPLYRRVCRPEIYQIKSTIYHTLTHYARQLKNRIPQVNRKRRSLSSTTPPRDVLVKQLCATLRLYDRILLEEFCPSLDVAVSKAVGKRSHRTTAVSEKRTLKLKEGLYTCDFCGADIFQSFFQCVDGVDNVGSEGDSFVLCPGCYAEGRTCACQEMEPMQRQDFASLFTVRWEALDILRRCGTSVEAFGGSGSLEEQKRYFSHQSDWNVFRAAVLLYHTRQQQRQDQKLCGYMGNHAVPSIWTLNCKKCHRAKCFPHLLKVHRMHSIQSLLLQEQDVTHEAFHQSHKTSPLAYEEGKRQLLKAQGDGSLSPDFSLHMVYNSLAFGFCVPINPTCATLGWYDSLVPLKNSVEQSKPRLTERSDANSTQVDEPQNKPLISTRRPLQSPLNASQMTKNRVYVEVPFRSHTPAETGPSKNSSIRASVPLPSHNTRDGTDFEGKSFPASKTQPISVLGKITIPRMLRQNEPQNKALASDNIPLFDDGSDLTPTSSDAESFRSSNLIPRDRRALLTPPKLTNSDMNTGPESRLANQSIQGVQVEDEGAALGISENGCERISSVTTPSSSRSLKRPAPIPGKSDNGSATAAIAGPPRKRSRREKAPDSKSRPTDHPSGVLKRADFSASLSNALNGAHGLQQGAYSNQIDGPVQEGTKITRADSQKNEEPSSVFTPLQPQLESDGSAIIEPPLSRETPLLNSTPGLSSSSVTLVTPGSGECAIAISAPSASLNSKDNFSTGKLMGLDSAELENVIALTSERVVKQLTENASTSPTLPPADIASAVMAVFATAGRLFNNNQTPLHHTGSSGSGPLPEGTTNQGQPIQRKQPSKKFGPKPPSTYQHQKGKAGTREYWSPHKFTDPYCTNLATRRSSEQWISPEATSPRNHTPRRSSDGDITATYRPERYPGDRPPLQRYDIREGYSTRSRDRAPTQNYGSRYIPAYRQHSEWANTDSRTQRPPSPPYFRDRSSVPTRIDDKSSFRQQSNNRKGSYTPPHNRTPAQRGFHEGAPERPHGGPSYRRTEQHVHSDDHMLHHPHYALREEPGTRKHASVLRQPGGPKGWTAQTSRSETTGQVPPYATAEESPENSPAQLKRTQGQARQLRKPPPHGEGTQFRTRAARRNSELAEAEAERLKARDSEAQINSSRVREQDGRETSTASRTRENHAPSRGISQHSLPNNTDPDSQKNTKPSREFQQRTNAKKSEETARRELRAREYSDHGSPSPSARWRRAGSESDLSVGPSQSQGRQNRRSQGSNTLQATSASTPRPVCDGDSAAELSRQSKEDQYWEDEYEG